MDHIKELREFDALDGGDEDSLRRKPVLEFCGEETSRIDQPSASDSVMLQEGLCTATQIPISAQISVQKDPGSTSDICIEQSRSDELREPSKSAELGTERGWYQRKCSKTGVTGIGFRRPSTAKYST